MIPLKKILIFEYITGGGLAGQTLPDTLIAEAELMLQALVTDLVDLPELEITVLRDARLQLLDAPVENLLINNAADQNYFWHDALTKTDAVWVIAPETDNVLETLCGEVEAAGVFLLNSSAEAIALTTSKSQTAKWLMEHDIPVVENQKAGLLPSRWVVKPDDGVGCEDIHLFSDQQIAASWLETKTDGREWVLQPWLEGEQLSFSLLCQQGEALILSVNRQYLVVQKGRLKLTACEVNALEILPEFCKLAEQVTKAIPGLWGYVGIDLLLTENGPVVVEINPRLTTSYVGLSKALDLNPAAMILSLLDQPLREMTVKNRSKCVRVDIADAA